MEDYKCKKELAVDALEKLGLKRKPIVIALKDLLEKCNGEWTHIEDDNYRLLVDFYFEIENDNTEKESNTRSNCKEQANVLLTQTGNQTVEPTKTADTTHSMDQSAPRDSAAVALPNREENIHPAVDHIAPKAKKVDKNTTLSASSSSSSVSCNHSMGPGMLLDGNRILESEGRSCIKHGWNNDLQTRVQISAVVLSDQPRLVSNISRNFISEMLDSTDCVQTCKKKRLSTEQVVENQSTHVNLANQKNSKSKLQHPARETISGENLQKRVLSGSDYPKTNSVNALMSEEAHSSKYEEKKIKLSVIDVSKNRRKLILLDDEACKEQEASHIAGSSLEDVLKSQSNKDRDPVRRKSSKHWKNVCIKVGEESKMHPKTQHSATHTMLASSADISDGVSLNDRSTLARTLAQPSSDACISTMEGNTRRINCKESVTDGGNSRTTIREMKHDPFDIARGEESIPIPYVNEYTNDSLPHFFHYIPKNLIYQNAHINFSIARIGEDDCCLCTGSCVKASIPCACTRETGGQYAYTPDGCLQEWFLSESMKDKTNDGSNPDRYKSYCKDYVCQIIIIKEGEIPEPCRGHYPRKFVKECCSKCGCLRTCGNRVVQRGICRKLQVFWTPEGKGWALRTLEDLPKGAFVCEYVGEIMTNYELYARNQTILKNAKHTYPVLLDADLCSEQHLADEALCLDATFYGNVARFINHRCYDSNMLDVPVSFDTADRHYYHHAFFTTRPVKAMEELTWDYSIDFEDEGHPVGCFQCLCGSEFCRGKQTAT